MERERERERERGEPEGEGGGGGGAAHHNKRPPLNRVSTVSEAPGQCTT